MNRFLKTRQAGDAPCRWVRERLWAFVESELAEMECRKVTTHLGACVTCASRLAATERARASLISAQGRPAGTEDVTDALAAAVARRLAERGSSDASLRSPPGTPMRTGIPASGLLWGTAIAVAGCLLAILIPKLPGPASVPGISHLPEAAAPGPAMNLAQAPTTAAPGASEPPTAPRVGQMPRSRPRILKPGHSTLNTQHSTLNTRPGPRRAPRGEAARNLRPPAVPAPAAPAAPAAPPRPRRAPMPVVRQQEPVLLVRETAESAPSYAFARSVTPSEQGDTATVVAVTREQTRPEDPVRVTLVIATGAAIAEDGKERLP